MNSKLVLLVCGLLAGVAAKDYPGYYGQFESTYEASKILTVGSESCTVEQLSSSTDASTTTDNSESNEKDDLIVCECPLTEYLYNISVVLKDTPYGEYFYQWFYEIQMEILADQSYSNEEKFAAVMSSLKSLCNEYPGMEDAISYIKLEGFGYVKDMFSAKAAIQCQSPEASQLLVLNGDSCKLFDAFLNDTSLSSEQLSALKTLFNEIKSSVLNGQYTSTDESILVFKHFRNFFKKHQGWESAFYNISIEGFGTFGDWEKCAETNYNLWTMSIQIGGDAASTPVLEAILAFANNASIDIGLRLQIKNFYNALLAKWETTTDEDTRLQMLMELVAQFSALEGFNLQALLDIEYSFEFEGIESSQSLYELLYQAYYKYKFGFSSQLSLVSSTSSAPISTTTGYLLVCDASYMALLTTNDPALNNQSPIVYSMWQVYYSNVWSTTCKNSLKAVITRCNTYITSFSSNGSTSQQKANAIFNYLAANPTNNPQCQQDILKVVIKTSSGESWGRVCDFATCTKQTGSNLACSS